MMDYNTLATLGFDRNPLSAIHQTADQTRIDHAVRMAVTDKSLLVVSGRRGMGKTTAVNRALRAMAKDGGLAIIQPNRVEVEQLRAVDLLVSTILDLSDETPAFQREKRYRQAIRAMGNSKKPVVLLIEEAHKLPYPTLLTLKRLREVSYQGVFPLLSIILVGQRNPLHFSRALDEVRLRSLAVDMQGLTSQEAAGIIKATVGRVFEEEAIQVAAKITPIWLDLQMVLAGAMTRAVTLARQTITVEDVHHAAEGVDPGLSLDFSDLGAAAKALNISGVELSQRVGMSKSRTYHALNGGSVTPETREKLTNALKDEFNKVKAA